MILFFSFSNIEQFINVTLHAFNNLNSWLFLLEKKRNIIF